MSLTADDLAKLPRQTVSLPAPDGTKIVYEGVTLLAVLQKAGAPFGKQLRGKVLSTYVLAKAQDGLLASVVTTANEFGLRDVTTAEPGLETVFIRLTGRDLRE